MDLDADRWSPRRHAALAVTLFALLVLRRPDALFHPQFLNEDLCVFFATRAAHGWTSLFVPFNGYFHLVPRVVALLASVVDAATQPLVFNLAALLIHALAASVFFLPGFGGLVASAWLRLAMCLCAVAALPGHEVVGTLTNVQWTLAPVALLLLFYDPPQAGHRTHLARAAAVLVCVLTAPLLVLAAPVALWRLVRAPLHHRGTAAVFLLGAGLQAAAYFVFPPPANQMPGVFTAGEILSGVSFTLLYRVVAGVTAGLPAAVFMAEKGLPPLWLLAALAAAWLAWMLRAFPGRRLWIAGAAGLAVLMLGFPLVARNLLGYFQTLSRDNVLWAQRYLTLPAAIVLLLAGMSVERLLPARLRIPCFLLLTLGAAQGNFPLSPFAEMHWSGYSSKVEAEYANQRSGRPYTRIRVPVNPPGAFCELP